MMVIAAGMVVMATGEPSQTHVFTALHHSNSFLSSSLLVPALIRTPTHSTSLSAAFARFPPPILSLVGAVSPQEDTAT